MAALGEGSGATQNTLAQAHHFTLGTLRAKTAGRDVAEYKPTFINHNHITLTGCASIVHPSNSSGISSSVSSTLDGEPNRPCGCHSTIAHDASTAAQANVEGRKRRSPWHISRLWRSKKVQTKPEQVRATQHENQERCIDPSQPEIEAGGNISSSPSTLSPEVLEDAVKVVRVSSCFRLAIDTDVHSLASTP